MEGESSELSASVLFETLLVAIRLSDLLPPPPPPAPVREKIDSRFGRVSAGEMVAGLCDISVSYIDTLTTS